MPFSTLEEMYQRTDFRLALIPATSYEDNFKYSNDPIWKAIYAERLQPYLEEYKKHPNDMVRLLKDDFTTALYESFIPVRYSDFLRNMHVAKFCATSNNSIYSTTTQFVNCEVVATQGKYFHRPFAWPFQKNSPYLDIFNFYIGELMEKGQWNAIMSKYVAPAQVCPDLSGQAVEFSTCFTAFLLLLVGFLLSLLCLAVEFAFKPKPKPLEMEVRNWDRMEKTKLVELVKAQWQLIHQLSSHRLTSSPRDRGGKSYSLQDWFLGFFLFFQRGVVWKVWKLIQIRF